MCPACLYTQAEAADPVESRLEPSERPLTADRQFARVPRAAILDARVNRRATVLRVLAVYALHANGVGRTVLSSGRAAQILETTDGKVRAALSLLNKLGYISRQRRRGQKSEQSAETYINQDGRWARVPSRLVRDTRLSRYPIALAVAARLGFHDDGEHRSIRISLRAIARDLGSEPANVRRAMQLLEQLEHVRDLGPDRGFLLLESRDERELPTPGPSGSAARGPRVAQTGLSGSADGALGERTPGPPGSAISNRISAKSISPPDQQRALRAVGGRAALRSDPVTVEYLADRLRLFAFNPTVTQEANDWVTSLRDWAGLSLNEIDALFDTFDRPDPGMSADSKRDLLRRQIGEVLRGHNRRRTKMSAPAPGVNALP